MRAKYEHYKGDRVIISAFNTRIRMHEATKTPSVRE